MLKGMGISDSDSDGGFGSSSSEGNSPKTTTKTQSKTANKIDEEQKSEEKVEGGDDEHNIDFETDIKLDKNEHGEKVLKFTGGQLTFKETIGQGGFCQVIKAIGEYDDTKE